MTHDARKPVLVVSLASWSGATAFVLAMVFLVGVIRFLGLAEPVITGLAGASIGERGGSILRAHARLIPAYLLIWSASSLVLYPWARRRLGVIGARRGRAWRPGRARLVLQASFWLIVFVTLARGPLGYLGTLHHDSLGSLVFDDSRPLEDSIYLRWRFREVLSLGFVGLLMLPFLDFLRWAASRMGGWPPILCGLIGVCFVANLAIPPSLVILSLSTPPPLEAPKPHVIVVASEALEWRRDATFGSESRVLSALDSFESEAFRFDQFHSSATGRAASWASFLTGRYPVHHGLRYDPLSREQANLIDRSGQTIPRVLHESGYRSVSVGARLPVDFGFADRRPRHSQDLDSLLGALTFSTQPLIPTFFGNLLGELLVPRLEDVSLGADANRLRRTFLHELDRTAAAGLPFFGTLVLPAESLAPRLARPLRELSTGAGPVRGIRFRARAAAGLDGQVEAIMRHLGVRGLDSETVVILTSDFGAEVFGPFTSSLREPARFLAGGESTRVPLLLRLPVEREGNERWNRMARVKQLARMKEKRLEKEKRIEWENQKPLTPQSTLTLEKQLVSRRPFSTVKQIVRTVDVLPTLVELLGASRFFGEIDGISVVPYLTGEKDDLGLAAFAETADLFGAAKSSGARPPVRVDRDFDDRLVLEPTRHGAVLESKQRMMRTARWKLIYGKGPRGPIYRFYDVELDPSQATDLSRLELSVMLDMKDCLRHWMRTGEDTPWSLFRDDLR